MNVKRTLQIVLPLAVVAVGASVAVLLYALRPEAERRAPQAVAPLVRVHQVALDDIPLTVSSQGTVTPRTESTLVAEVGGSILEVGPSFVAGGFFQRGELLVRIDPGDYRQAVVRSRARIAEAELRLAREEAEAEVARREWQDLGGGAEPSPLTLRQPQVAEAEAALAAARADLEVAERNLQRTEVRAPYPGRVRDKRVGVGQFVTPGTPLASIYAVDVAEVRLPLPSRELAYLDLPLGHRGASGPAAGPPVILRAEFAGATHQWSGRIVRTEGEIDPRTRMIHAVAQVEDPYGRGPGTGRPPLAVGMFVHAEIQGEMARGVAVLPRAALRGETQVLVVDGEDRLRFRDVEVLRRTETSVIIRAGLEDGERVCLSPLAAVTDGMQVRTEGPG